MNTKVLGLACIATLTAPAAWGLEKELQVGPDELRGNLELMNQHWSPGASAVINPSSTGHASGDYRFYDVGVHLDGYLALDGNPGNAEITDFETTEITARFDYLFEIENILQVLPFVEVTVYPYLTGKSKYNWIGLEAWYLTPVEGLELGASMQYNISDNTVDDSVSDHYVLTDIGARYLHQQAPLDLSAWSILTIGNRAYNDQLAGAYHQGATTFNIGGQATLPLPWESTWTFLKIDSYWYVDDDIRDALATADRDRTELVFALGVEYRN